MSSKPNDVLVLSPASLTGSQRRALRGLGHHLKPVISIGQRGITDALVEATLEVLDRYELIKLSVQDGAPLDRKEAPVALAARTGSHVAQVIGRTALLYRRRFDEPEIALPGVIDEAKKPKGRKA